MDTGGLVLAGWNFETLRTGTLAGFVDSRLQRFPGLDIRRVPALRLHLKREGTEKGSGVFSWQDGDGFGRRSACHAVHVSRLEIAPIMSSTTELDDLRCLIRPLLRRV